MVCFSHPNIFATKKGVGINYTIIFFLKLYREKDFCIAADASMAPLKSANKQNIGIHKETAWCK